MTVSGLLRSGLVLALLSGLAGVAAADPTKDSCIDANANAQRLRLTGKLRAARGELLTCASASCPGMVRDDCTRRLDELDHVQPTIILDVKDEAENDATNVRVGIDGVPLAGPLNGAAESVDPGLHTFTFTAPGHAAVTRTFLIKEGEKGRRERVVLTPGAFTRVPVLPETADAQGSANGRTQRTLGLAAGGVGVAGVLVGAIFGGLADSAWQAQESACGSRASCTTTGHATALTDHDRLTTDGAVSTAGFIAGGVLIAGGAALFFTAHRPATSGASAVTLAPALGPRRASLALEATF